jgi:hypothetical protein
MSPRPLSSPTLRPNPNARRAARQPQKTAPEAPAPTVDVPVVTPPAPSFATTNIERVTPVSVEPTPPAPRPDFDGAPVTPPREIPSYDNVSRDSSDEVTRDNAPREIDNRDNSPRGNGGRDNTLRDNNPRENLGRNAPRENGGRDNAGRDNARFEQRGERFPARDNENVENNPPSLENRAPNADNFGGERAPDDDRFDGRLRFRGNRNQLRRERGNNRNGRFGGQVGGDNNFNQQNNQPRRREVDILALQNMEMPELGATAAEFNIENPPEDKDALIYAILEAQAHSQNAILKRGTLEILGDGKGFCAAKAICPLTATFTFRNRKSSVSI